ncbi:MAG TPA: hypothetical protein VGP54_06935, partial [Gaiellaceae bacterium]|nr:hypothetical protein [Gaiellaceae bacterium]
MKGFVLMACAVAAGMVLWGSAAGAAQDGSAGPLAQSVAVSTRHIPLSRAAGIAKPQALAGVPAKGSYAFLLKLGTEPTARVYDASLPHGLSAARTAAKDQLATVRAAQSRVIAALPTGSHVLYQT